MFYNQNQFLPELLYARYVSGIRGALDVTFADEIKIHSTLELPGLCIRRVIFYLAFENVKVILDFSESVLSV